MKKDLEITKKNINNLAIDQKLKNYVEKEIASIDKSAVKKILVVLSMLKRDGNVDEIEREIACFAVSRNIIHIEKMKNLLKENGFKFHDSYKISKKLFGLKFSYFSDTCIKNIIHHKKIILYITKNSKCEFDGWGTTVEVVNAK